MKKIENTALQMIAEASRCPDYGPDMVKSLMKKLDMNEKGFAQKAVTPAAFASTSMSDQS